MKCPPEEQLVEYAAGRLSTSERWQLSEHLECCPDCREQVAELRAVDEWLDLLAVPETEHVADETLAALAEGTLDDLSRARALVHVGECPECARLLGALRRELVAEALPVVAAASAAMTARKPEPRSAVPVLWRWATAGAAAAALMITFTILFAPRLSGPTSAPGPVMTAERAAAPVTPPAVAGGAAKTAAPKPSPVAVASQPPAKKPAALASAPPTPARSHRKGRPHSAFEGRQVAQLPPAPAYAPVPVPPSAPTVMPDMATRSAEPPAMKAMDSAERGRIGIMSVAPKPAAPPAPGMGAPGVAAGPTAPTMTGLGGGAPGARAEVAPAENLAGRSAPRVGPQKARPFPTSLHNAKQRAKQAKAEGQ